jgi:CRP/FNR family transcriptional regulator
VSGVSLKLIHVKSACENCAVRKLCLPTTLEGVDLERLGALVHTRPTLKKGEYLYHAGTPFKGLYAIQSGSLKTYGLTMEGKEQVTGFHLNGELVGMDAIDGSVHPCNAVALENTEVCLIPYEDLKRIEHEIPELMVELNRIMSREIRRDGQALMMLGTLSAEQRLASFLVQLYDRMQERGAGVNEMQLSMTRQDIGNYLGLAIETVSRNLSILQDEGWIRINKRKIEILDRHALENLVG